jgi:hypothetical protein
MGGNNLKITPIRGFGLVFGGALALALALPAAAAPDTWPTTNKGVWPTGIFSKENLAKPRPKAPWDMTGTWTMKNQPETGGFNFIPLPKFKPNAQKIYDDYLKATEEGKAYRDDTAHCWPYGMPRWLTRVWPIQFMQYPTGIVAVQGLFNSVRQIYLDGRGHVDPDIIEPTYNGDSVGRFEGDTLVIDTIGFTAKRHWITHGITLSDQLHIIERIKMAKDHQSFTDEITMIDPVNWEGEWKNTKTYIPVKGQDVVESQCLPDLDDNIVGAFDENQTK